MIRIELKEEALVAGLARLSAGLDDMTPVMNQIGEYLITSTKKRFGKGVDPDGNPWAANSPVTLARKKGTRPLFGESNQLNTQIFHEAGPTQVEVGSPMVYAGVQQFGAAQGEFGAFIGKDKKGRDHFHSIPWGDVPARPFIGVSEEDETALTKIVEVYLAGLVQP